MKKLFTLIAFVGLATMSFAEESTKSSLDYGDYTSSTLQGKSWDALGEGRYEDTLKYTAKCTKLYEKQAREMQASLSSKPAEKNVHDYWALNDVGTCYFIRGEALMKMKKYEEALAAFSVVKDELYYAQCWDPKGWFWSPSDAAYVKVEMIQDRINGDF